MTEVGREFAAAEEVKTFVRANRNGKIADSYVSAAQLSDEEAKALIAGEMYGPVLKNNEWTMSRALDSKMVPDSVGVRHIVLPYAQEALADSLLTVLKKGGDFAQTAARYSVYDATAANGGEVGVLPFSAFTGEFAAALANARQGDIVKIASGDAIQLMQVYRADKPSKHVQVATITYPVEASAATRRDVHNQAGSFMVNAKGSAAAFADAASTAAVTPRVAAIAQGDRTIRGLEDSREVARWAYGAKEGDLSAIFNVGKDYVIATLTEIDDNEYAPLNKVSAQYPFAASSRQKIRLYRQEPFGFDPRRAGCKSRLGGGGLLRCDFRFVLRERRGHGASSGGRHRIGREGRPVGSREGTFGRLCLRGRGCQDRRQADRRRRESSRPGHGRGHGPAVRHPGYPADGQDSGPARQVLLND